jgi:putative component of toxin-antitoxin plasmid stabilization module
MSQFFLNSQSLKTKDFDSFKYGILELMQIEKKQEHIFYRNESCYEISHFADSIYPNLNDIDIFNIYNFFAKLSPCQIEVENEVTANEFCSNEVNGFLGIDFNCQEISQHKKIVNRVTYSNWITHHQTNFEQLTSFISKSIITKNFEKSYYSLKTDVQKSIKEEFEKAASRNLTTRFYPDTKIIKDVSISNKCTVLELRVYHPVALRVYFNQIGDTVYLASIEQKSNPNQNEDIQKAEKLLKLINS